jgi:uncharacterized membrane protein YfcA
LRPSYGGLRPASFQPVLVIFFTRVRSVVRIPIPGEQWRQLSLSLSILGLLIAGPLAGFFLGDWLARKFGQGWLTWFMMLLGFVAAGRQIYLITRRIQREQEKPPRDGSNESSN